MGDITTCNGAKILNPDGSVLVSSGCIGYHGGFIDTQTLSAGTYTIVVDPQGPVTGSLTVTLNNVVDFTGTLGVNDPSPTAVSISTPGQNGWLSFSGAANQSVTVAITNNLPGTCTTVTLFRQDQTTQLASTLSCSASFNLQQSLPATETYYIKIDPTGPSTGTINVRVTNP
jgi:hypothetical protein